MPIGERYAVYDGQGLLGRYTSLIGAYVEARGAALAMTGEYWIERDGVLAGYLRCTAHGVEAWIQ